MTEEQTVSKWEKGLSAPDCDMLLSLSEILGTPISILLGENVSSSEVNELQAICDKLEVINLQLARQRAVRRKLLHGTFVFAGLAIIAIFTIIIIFGSSYTDWDYSNQETAVVGTIFHGFEWIFVRVAPFGLAVAIVGAVLTKNKG